MPEDTRSRTNISGAGPGGAGPGRKTDAAPGAEDRSVQTRPGDVEAAAPAGGPAGTHAPHDPAKGADAEEADMSNSPNPRDARS